MTRELLVAGLATQRRRVLRYPGTSVYSYPMTYSTNSSDTQTPITETQTVEEVRTDIQEARAERERAAGTDDETLVIIYTDEIAELEDQARRFRLIRDDIIRRLIAKHGKAETARITGLSLSTIKTVKGRPQPRSENWPLDVAD